MTWMTLDQFFLKMEGSKCRYCDKKATWFAGAIDPLYCDDCYNTRFGDLKLSGEIPSSNSASEASDLPTQH